MPRMPRIPRLLTLACAAALLVADSAASPVRADELAERFPADVRAALEALPGAARPVELRASPGGALYALLPNGAELIVQEKRNAPVVSVQAWVRTGAIHEQEWMGAGLSHYCEHLLFKGTTKRPTGQLDQDIRGGGGDNNAYTNSERTVYHATTAASSFATAFDAIADMVANSTFPPEEVKKEHGVVRKELERASDDPDRALYDTFEATVYQVHPYRVPVLGYLDRFDRVTREEVYAYYKRRYSPSNTVFIAVGDFAAADALTFMAKTVAPWKRTSVPPALVPSEPEQIAPREVAISHHLAKVPKLILGFPTVSARDPDLYALDVLASVLGSGRSSRLYQTVKDQQKLVLDVAAFNYTPTYPGYFGVSATAEAANLEAARAAILAVLEDARRRAPDAAELARVKREIASSRVFNLMTAEGIAEQLGQDWLTTGDLDFARLYAERIQSVTPEQVLAVARKYLDPMKLNVALLTAAPPAGAASSAEPTTSLAPPATTSEAASASQASELEALRALPEVRDASARTLAGTTVFELTLASGLRVVVREDASIPVVHGAIASLGGQRSEPADQAGAGNLVAHMLDRGSAAFTKAELAAQVEGLGADLSPFGGRNTVGLQFRCLKDDLPKLLGLAAESFLRPAFPVEELDGLRREVLAQIDEQEENLASLDLKLLRSLVFGAHPYSRPVLGTKESVLAITGASLSDLHRAWVRPESSVVSFSGDVRASDAVRLVLDTFKSFPLSTSTAQSPAPIEPIDAPRAEAKAVPGLTGAALALGFQGVKLGDADREVLDLTDRLLSGLGGRLYEVLREQLGIAYQAFARNDSQVDGGFFTFFIQTDPQNVERAKQVFASEIERLKKQPVPAKELEAIKKYFAGTEAIALQEQGGVALNMGLSVLYGQGIENVFTRHEKIEKITPQDIQAAARKYFVMDRSAVAVVKP
ncbi:MAG: insulinase family protein [Deltaproteobacteria bacterium]|nr:insulinase family protein [Deltaproteobacteria bacterium]